MRNLLGAMLQNISWAPSIGLLVTTIVLQESVSNIFELESFNDFYYCLCAYATKKIW